MVFTMILLCLIGVAWGGGLGFLYLLAVRRLTKKDMSASSKETRTKNCENAAVQKQLFQLRGQLDSGLLTKEEYAAKKQEILKSK